MKRKPSAQAKARNDFCAFPSTHWTQLARTGGGDTTAQREALETVLSIYWPALLTHLTAIKRISRHRAEDLLQGFIASKVLEQQLISRAERGRGRFRTFILSALDRFVISEFRKEAAKKRAPDALVPLEDREYGIPAKEDVAREFDVAWAREVLKEALRRMRAECETSERPKLWELFDRRVLQPAFGDTRMPPYDELVTDLGITSPSEAYNLLVTAKRMYARYLEAVVGEYAASQGGIREEIGSLFAILSSTGAE